MKPQLVPCRAAVFATEENFADDSRSPLGVSNLENCVFLAVYRVPKYVFSGRLLSHCHGFDRLADGNPK